MLDQSDDPDDNRRRGPFGIDGVWCLALILVIAGAAAAVWVILSF